MSVCGAYQYAQHSQHLLLQPSNSLRKLYIVLGNIPWRLLLSFAAKLLVCPRACCSNVPLRAVPRNCLRGPRTTPFIALLTHTLASLLHQMLCCVSFQCKCLSFNPLPSTFLLQVLVLHLPSAPLFIPPPLHPSKRCLLLAPRHCRLLPPLLLWPPQLQCFRLCSRQEVKPLMDGRQLRWVQLSLLKSPGNFRRIFLQCSRGHVV